MRLQDPVGPLTDRAALRLEKAIADGVPVRGRVRVQLFGPDGKLKLEQFVENLVVTAGKNHIADRLSSAPGGAAMSHMAIGTGGGAPAAGDTALTTELDRNALTSFTDANNVVTYVGDWAAGDGTGTLTEAGIFNAAAAGTMLARVAIAVTKAAGDTLKITWTVTIG